MEKQVFQIFGKILRTNKTKVSFTMMCRVSLKHGLFVPEELCYEWLYDYLEDTHINPNSTFYKAWQDVLNKDRFQLFLDQVQHYASTYGTNFEGEAWIPNDGNVPEFPFKELKVVEAITEEELKEEVRKLATSSIALKSETLDFIIEAIKVLNISIDLNDVKIRELKLKLIPDNYKFNNGQECLMWILWKWFHISMLVKNQETLRTIGYTLINPPTRILSALTQNKEVLASVFYRNKDVFMQFKKNTGLRHIVNVIRKLAKKHHKPMEMSPWLKLDKLSLQERNNLFEKASIFKLVQIYNALNNPSGYYVIRNGKAFFKGAIIRPTGNLLSELLYYIVQKVPKVDAVSLPKNITLAMPTSEKNFIGDVPIGSYIECAEKDTMVGIYWKNEWNSYDLDLHIKTGEGVSLGWNGAYFRNEDIIFSGDMTNADPEATEVMWFRKNPEDSFVVSVNQYNGNSNYFYDFFVAQESATNFAQGYMVDPRNIIYKARISPVGKDTTIGYYNDGKFTFHSCNIGGGMTPSKFRQQILEHLCQCKYLTVEGVLELAEIPISDDADIKLESKGDLINFFS